jgi:hypothetical protein
MLLHSVRTALVVEHSRRHAFAQATVLALCLFALSATTGSASDTGTAVVNLLPADGKHRGIVLKSQTVDATISAEEGKLWADTRVWLKLHNPASKPITLSVTLPGPQMAPVPLPVDLDVRVDNVPLRWLPSNGAEGGSALSATAAIGIPARSSVDVRLAFRQALPEDQGVVAYVYMLGEADQWAGTPESLRVTVQLKPPVAMRSLLSTVPPAHRTDPQTLIWDWESEWVNSKASVGVAFMSPAWFAEFDAARAAASGERVGAAQHMVLSQHYRRLASLPAQPFDAQPMFHSRYYPLAIAELQAAIATSSTRAERAQAHSTLADLYVQQADRAEPGAREEYLQAAAAEVESALDGTTPEPGLLELARKIFGELSENAGTAGDYATATSYLHRLEGIQARSSQQAAQGRLADSDLSQVTQAMELGDAETTRDLIVSLYGFQAADLPGASPPLVSQTSLTVTTTLEGRRIAVLLGRGENLEEASHLARQTAEAFRLQGRAQVVASANSITITLPGPPGPAVIEVQQTLAAALPDVPELDLLRSVLADTRGSESTQTSLLRSTWSYTERVDLGSALQHWQEIATRFESAQAEPLPGLPPAKADQVQRIQRALSDSSATAWRRFAASSRADYLFEPSTSDTTREWQVRAGETREMFVQNSRWNLDSIRWAAIALCIAVVGLAALVWHLA